VGSISYAYWHNSTACIRVRASYSDEYTEYPGLPSGSAWNIDEKYTSPYPVRVEFFMALWAAHSVPGDISVSLRDYAPTKAGKCTVLYCTVCNTTALYCTAQSSSMMQGA